jgi:hypothetical protein
MEHVHPVMRGPGQESNVIVRHPPNVGPHMMAPGEDHAEMPSGSLGHTPPGGIIGGLAPFQTSKGAEMGDFQPGVGPSARGEKTSLSNSPG